MTRNELYGKDYPHVQEVRARLLRLAPDVTPTDAQINASPRFALSPGAVEKDALDIVTDTGCLHIRVCLRRASLTVSGKRRQVAFCPYCGRY